MAFATYSGVLIEHPFIQMRDINVIDIAHHLTNINRFGGSLDFDQHYSVAEHSILLAQYCLYDLHKKGMAAYALLHDASEAYLGDVVSGLKYCLPEYVKLESEVMLTILSKYDVQVYPYVHELDKRIVLNEAKALMPQHYNKFNKHCLSPLSIDNLAVNDDDYGTYTPGTVPKQIVFDKFLEICNLLDIRD